jgi:hypothetical protein
MVDIEDKMSMEFMADMKNGVDVEEMEDIVEL